MPNNKPAERFALPEGTLVNFSFFEKDSYTGPSGEASKPQYKCELAMEWADFDDIHEKIVAFGVEHWGPEFEERYDAEPMRCIPGWIDGDREFRRREKLGKPGDVYKDRVVVRPHTSFNLNGDDAPGGIYVCNERAEKVEPAGADILYRGCRGVAVVSLGKYAKQDPVSGEDLPAITFYLHGFQKTGDGDRLVAATDYSKMFKPVGKAEGGRKSRKK